MWESPWSFFMNDNGILTVCTSTVGDSSHRLDIFMPELRAFTSVPFRHIVSDDCTPIAEYRNRQKTVCERYGAEHTVNPGRPSLPGNLNYLVSLCRTPWAYILEDGVRPSRGWLEAILSFIEQTDNRKFGGFPVGMFGVAAFQDWMLAMGKALPGSAAWHYLHGRESYDTFYGDGWNDGYWCWKRLLPGMAETCTSPESESWPDEVRSMRDIIRNAMKSGDLSHLRSERHWPTFRSAYVACYPGGPLVVRLDALQKCGGFHPQCTFYEGHLGVRMFANNYLSLYLEMPPLLHKPSLGFSAVAQGNFDSIGVPHDHGDVSRIFIESFGHNNIRATWDYAFKFITLEDQQRATDDLASVKAYAVPGWEKWF
jgi:hypothetical protein